TGPGVRWDSGIEHGSDVTLFYDPMLAKLIVWAPTRESAITRMHRALLELTIQGVDTSRDFHLRVMEDDDFKRGAIEIQWLERRLPSLLSAKPTTDVRDIAAIAAALLADRERHVPSRSSSPSLAATTSPTPSDGYAEAWARAGRLDSLR